MIPTGSMQDIMQTSINSSYLWSSCKVLKLSKNMRFTVAGTSNNNDEVKNFSQRLFKVGDGLAGDSPEGEAEVEIPSDILIKDFKNAFDDLINFVYLEML